MPLSRFIRSISDSVSNSRATSTGPAPGSNSTNQVTRADDDISSNLERAKKSSSSDAIYEKVLEEGGEDGGVMDSPKVKHVQRKLSMGRSGRIKQKNRRKQLADNPGLSTPSVATEASPVVSPSANNTDKSPYDRPSQPLRPVERSSTDVAVTGRVYSSAESNGYHLTLTTAAASEVSRSAPGKQLSDIVPEPPRNTTAAAVRRVAMV